MTFRASTEDLFGGNPDLRVAVTLPYRANLIYDWLGPESNISMEELRDYHSAWQYLQLSGQISQEDLRPVIQADTKPGRRNQSRMISLLLGDLPTIRYCPLCITADTVMVREAYWHQSHQLCGVKYCPVHGARLLPYNNLALTKRLGRYIPASAVLATSSLEEMTNVGYSSVEAAERQDPFYGHYLRLAHVIAWLLEYGLSLGNFGDIVKMYSRSLGIPDDSSPRGDDLLQIVTETWSIEFVNDLSPNGELIDEIRNTPLSRFRPISHALLIGAIRGIR